jgi:hypothetical protein
MLAWILIPKVSIRTIFYILRHREIFSEFRFCVFRNKFGTFLFIASVKDANSLSDQPLFKEKLIVFFRDNAR